MKRFVAGLIIGLMLGMSGVAIADDGYVQAVFAKFRFVVNGVEKDPGVDPLVYQGTSYLPVRAISNMLGYDVTYKADSRTIELTKAVEREVKSPLPGTPGTEFEGVPSETLLSRLESLEFIIEQELEYIDHRQEGIDRINEEIKQNPNAEQKYEGVRESYAKMIENSRQKITKYESEKSAILEELARRGELPQTE